MKFLKNLLKRILFGLSKVAKKAIPLAYDVVDSIKKLAENPKVSIGLDFAAELIPTEFDDKLFAIIKNDLPTILTKLLNSEDKVMEILANETPENQLKLAIAEIKKATKEKKGSIYLETGSKLAEIYSDYKLTRAESITFLQGHHESLK